jgi:hydroxymethylglutaryl-CoA lyase
MGELPQAVSELPQAVSIREVGPRDGFQNEPEVIPTERKVELIDALARTGLRRLEATSFVRADVIPQLADAAEVLGAIDVPAEVSVSVLIPNERGLDAALELRERVRRPSGAGGHGAGARGPGAVAGDRDASAGGERAAFDEINVFMSASETHNRRNVNRSIAESLAGLELVLGRAREAGLRCRHLDVVRLPV